MKSISKLLIILLTTFIASYSFAAAEGEYGGTGGGPIYDNNCYHYHYVPAMDLYIYPVLLGPKSNFQSCDNQYKNTTDVQHVTGLVDLNNDGNLDYVPSYKTHKHDDDDDIHCLVGKAPNP